LWISGAKEINMAKLLSIDEIARRLNEYIPPEFQLTEITDENIDQLLQSMLTYFLQALVNEVPSSEAMDLACKTIQTVFALGYYCHINKLN